MFEVVVILGLIGIGYLIIESNDQITRNQKKIYEILKEIKADNVK